MRNEVEIKEHLHKWIEHISVLRPELGGFAVCPYAHSAKISFHFVHSSEKTKIALPEEPEIDIEIYVVEDEIEIDELIHLVDSLNENYPELYFIDDHRDFPGFIQGVQTTNGKYNLIVKQGYNNLMSVRRSLGKTAYYSFWSKEMIKDVLGDDAQFIIENQSEPQASACPHSRSET